MEEEEELFRKFSRYYDIPSTLSDSGTNPHAYDAYDVYGVKYSDFIDGVIRKYNSSTEYEKNEELNKYKQYHFLPSRNNFKETINLVKRLINQIEEFGTSKKWWINENLKKMSFQPIISTINEEHSLKIFVYFDKQNLKSYDGLKCNGKSDVDIINLILKSLEPELIIHNSILEFKIK